jgi:hypothetical protein
MSAQAVARLQKELREISRTPLPGLRALPLPTNLCAPPPPARPPAAAAAAAAA